MALPPLYKFLDVRGAKLTLSNRTFKHAKPSDFNDTEDLTIGSIFPGELESALQEMAASFPEALLANLNEQPTCEQPLRERVALLQSAFRKNPETARNIIAQMKAEGAAIWDIEYMRVRTQQFVDEINKFMQDYRVLCVTTRIDSTEMWNEYAEEGRGIALRIEPNMEKDSKFSLFRAVEYSEARPPLYASVGDYVAGSLFGDQLKRRGLMIEKVVHSKTNKWAHESEFRLAIPIRAGESWDTLPYHPEEIVELYLGSKMSEADRNGILAMAMHINPQMKVFQVEFNQMEEIAFVRIY